MDQFTKVLDEDDDQVSELEMEIEVGHAFEDLLEHETPAA